MSNTGALFKDIVNNDVLLEEELITLIEKSMVYTPVLKYSSVKEYLINFVVALYHHEPIILMDSDFSENEMTDLGLAENLGEVKKLDKSKVKSQRDWVKGIKESTSLITLFTSGTTGIPKQVQHTVASLTRMVRIGDNYQNNRWVLAYNPTHMAGLQVLFQALLNRNLIVNIFGASIDIASKGIIEENVTNISATPTFYRMLVSTGNRFPEIKRVTVGGEKSNRELHRKMQLAFPNAKLNNIYASTELGALFVSNGEVFKISSNLTSKVQVSDDGELLVHASLLPNKKIESEWYPTGDLVKIKSQEPLAFTFISRKTEMINIGGYKVNPNEVEGVILLFPGVVNCRVFGKPNSVLGNILCAEVQMSENSEFNKRNLQQFISTRLQDYKIPRIVKKVNLIDTTRTGKITRKS